MNNFIASCAPSPASGVRDVGGSRGIPGGVAVGGGGREENERITPFDVLFASIYLMLEDDELVDTLPASTRAAQRRVMVEERHRLAIRVVNTMITDDQPLI